MKVKQRSPREARLLPRDHAGRIRSTEFLARFVDRGMDAQGFELRCQELGEFRALGDFGKLTGRQAGFLSRRFRNGGR